MAKLTFLGHPLHPQLVEFPLGLLPFSLVMDVMHLATGNESYADTAYHTMVGGVVGGLAAGAAGAADYFTIPPGTKSAKAGNVHAALNLGIMGLYGLNLLLRRGRRDAGGVPLLLSILGTAGLVASAWYGGQLVYDLGMRVKPATEGDDSPEWKLPGDDAAHRALEAVEQAV
jgi:uncharacterized membrane protein